MSSTVKIILQARLNSSRLPAKAMLDICGMPSVAVIAKRAGNLGDKVTVATSTDLCHDLLCKVLDRYDINYVRGSLDDVMGRFLLATEELDDADTIVRLTADNLFQDNDYIRKSLAEYNRLGQEWLGCGGPNIDLPYGIGVEAFNAGKFRQYAREFTDAYAREHVTPPFYRDKFIPVPCRENLTGLPSGFGNLRCTMDTFEDYCRVAKAFNAAGGDPLQVSWETLCEILKEQENDL